MNENSPICVNPIPTRNAVAFEYRNTHTTPVHTTYFPASTSAATSTIIGQLSFQAFGSSSIPTDTKKNATNTSRSGCVCRASLCVNSEFPRNNPARNAPSAKESPISSVSAAIPMQTVSASNNEISSLQVFSTLAKSGGNTFHATNAIGASSRIAFVAWKVFPPLLAKVEKTCNDEISLLLA